MKTLYHRLPAPVKPATTGHVALWFTSHLFIPYNDVVKKDMKRDMWYAGLFLLIPFVYFWEFPLKGLILAFGDGMLQFYPKISVAAEQYRSGVFPFWNPYEFSGFPLLAGTQFEVMYPPTVLLFQLLPAPLAYNVTIMLHFAMAGVFTFLYARLLGIERGPAVGAGMVFSLLGYLPAQLQVMAMINTGAWLPLIMYTFERLRRNPDVRIVFLGAFAVAMQIFAGHSQTCFYTLVLLTLFVIYHLIAGSTGRRLRFVFSAVAAYGLGVLLALPQILSTLELARFGGREHIDFSYFSLFSLGLDMLPTFIFPFLYGGGYSVYEGMTDSPFKVVQGFMGLLPLTISVVVFLREGWRHNHIRFFGLAAIITFVLALGNTIPPLYEILYRIPGFNLFRAPNRHLYEMSFSISMLTGFGLSMLLAEDRALWYRKVLIAVMAIMIAATVLSLTAFSEEINRLYGAGSVMRQHLSLSHAVILVPLATMILYLTALLMLSKAWRQLTYVLLIVIFFEAMSYRVTPVYPLDYAETYKRELFAHLRQDLENRVFLATRKVRFHELAMTHGIRTIRGYDPLYIQDYGKLLGLSMSGHVSRPDMLIMNNLVLSMLNVRHVVVDESMSFIEQIRGRPVRDEDGRIRLLPPFTLNSSDSRGFAPVYRNAFTSNGLRVFENLNTLPRAYSVRQIVPLEGVEQVLNALMTFRLDPRLQASVAADDVKRIRRREFAPGSVSIVRSTPISVTLRAEFQGPGFVVLADQFYPGWRAYVDGKRTPIFRTDGVLRGITIPAGEHGVVFRFVPVHLYASMAASFLVFVSMVLLALRSSRIRRRRSRTTRDSSIPPKDE